MKSRCPEAQPGHRLRRPSAVSPALWVLPSSAQAAQVAALLNDDDADPHHELYEQYTTRPSPRRSRKRPRTASPCASLHGGSGQAGRSVIDGLGNGSHPRSRRQHRRDRRQRQRQAAPGELFFAPRPEQHPLYPSTIIFLVRKTCPAQIGAWGDLIKSDVKVIVAEPEDLGWRGWNYLAAWAWALKRPSASPAKAPDFVKKSLASVPVRRQRRARLHRDLHAAQSRRRYYPLGEARRYSHSASSRRRAVRDQCAAVSILAEPPVAWVDANVDHFTIPPLSRRPIWRYLYTPEGRNRREELHHRPRDQAVAAKYAAQFKKIPTLANTSRTSAAGRRPNRSTSATTASLTNLLQQ